MRLLIFKNRSKHDRWCAFSSIYLSILALPLDAVSRCQNIAIIDQHSSAIEPVEVAEPSHPGKFINARCLATNNATRIVPFAASFLGGKRERLIEDALDQELVHSTHGTCTCWGAYRAAGLGYWRRTGRPCCSGRLYCLRCLAIRRDCGWTRRTCRV